MLRLWPELEIDEKQQQGAWALSQSKSEDNWAQEVWKAATETFKPTREQARDIRKLKRMGFNDFADTWVEYLRREQQEGPLEYSLQEFCESRGVQYRSLK